MIKIWAKTTVKDKIKLSRVFEFEKKFKIEDFYKYLSFICGEMDIPVPIVLKKHEEHFIRFNNTRFRFTDFIESVDFTFLILENMPEEKTPKNNF